MKITFPGKNRDSDSLAYVAKNGLYGLFVEATLANGEMIRGMITTTNWGGLKIDRYPHIDWDQIKKIAVQ